MAGVFNKTISTLLTSILLLEDTFFLPLLVLLSLMFPAEFHLNFSRSSEVTRFWMENWVIQGLKAAQRLWEIGMLKSPSQQWECQNKIIEPKGAEPNNALLFKLLDPNNPIQLSGQKWWGHESKMGRYNTNTCSYQFSIYHFAEAQFLEEASRESKHLAGSVKGYL